MWAKQERRTPDPILIYICVYLWISGIFGQLASNQTYLLRLNALPIISASAAVGGTGRRRRGSTEDVKVEHVPPEITWPTFVEIIFNC